MREIRVLTALPQGRSNRSVSALLHTLDGIRVMGSLHNAADVDGLAQVGAFDVIVFDHDIPGKDWTWIKVIDRMRGADRRAGFVLLSDFSGRFEDGVAIDDGLGRVVPKNCPPAQLARAIREVAMSAELAGIDRELRATGEHIGANTQPPKARTEPRPTRDLVETAGEMGKKGVSTLRAAIWCGLGLALIAIAALHQSQNRDFGQVPYTPPSSNSREQLSEITPGTDANDVAEAPNSPTSALVQTSSNSLDAEGH